MGLSENDRGVLEKIIDKTIIESKENFRVYSEPKMKQFFQIQNVEEFVFGMAFNQINQAFSSYLSTVYGKATTEDKIEEMTEVVVKRLPELRKSIYFSE